METDSHAVALNEARPEPDRPENVFALNAELPAGDVPEWIELLPAGERIQGRDGRWWINDRPEEIVAAFNGGYGPLPVDWDHASAYAGFGGTAPAAGWVEELAIHGGIIRGRVTWTEKGRESVAGREYRYISPEFRFDPQTNRILEMCAVGLTNRPNLRLAALNAKQPDIEDKMDFAKLLAALGLPKDATEEQALNAIRKLQDDRQAALNRAQTPDLSAFVPRPDYDKAMNSAKAAEEKLAEREKAEREKEIEAAVNGALEAGKIAPATKDYYLAMCRTEGGLEKFRDFVKAAPEIAPDSGLDGKAPGGGDLALNAEEAAVARMFGNNAEEIQKYGRPGA